MAIQIIYVYFDLLGPFPGWELRTAFLLRDLGHRVMTVPLHRRPLMFHPQTSNFDVVYASNAVAAPLGAALAEATNKPLVIQFLDCPLDPELQNFIPTIQGSTEMGDRRFFNAVDKRLWKKPVDMEPRIAEWELIKKITKKAAGTTAISKASADTIKKCVDIDIQKINWLGADAEIADEAGDQLPKKRVGYVGSTRPHKCVEELVFGLCLLPEQPEFYAILEDTPDFDKWAEMKSCLVGATMSAWEGFGLGPVEWGYVKRACICRSVPSQKEVMKDKAIYVTGPTELAAWVRQFLDNPDYALRKGQEAYEHIINNKLTLKDHAIRIVEYLEEILH